MLWFYPHRAHLLNPCWCSLFGICVQFESWIQLFNYSSVSTTQLFLLLIILYTDSIFHSYNYFICMVLNSRKNLISMKSHVLKHSRIDTLDQVFLIFRYIIGRRLDTKRTELSFELNVFFFLFLSVFSQLDGIKYLWKPELF